VVDIYTPCAEIAMEPSIPGDSLSSAEIKKNHHRSTRARYFKGLRNPQSFAAAFDAPEKA